MEPRNKMYQTRLKRLINNRTKGNILEREKNELLALVFSLTNKEQLKKELFSTVGGKGYYKDIRNIFLNLYDRLHKLTLFMPKNSVLKREALARAYLHDPYVQACIRACVRVYAQAKRDDERMRKTQYLVNIISRHNTPIFVSTVVINPRCEHRDLEGKYYYDANYKLYTTPEMSRKIARFVANRKLISVQEVINNPHWLVMANNCRHSLIPVEANYALSHSSKSVVKHFNLTLKQCDTISEAESIARRYEKKRDEMISVYKVVSSDSIYHAILKNDQHCYEWYKKVQTDKH